MKHDTAQSSAFTIVELLVVIAIFTIVVLAVVPAVGTFMEQMNAQQAYEMMAAQIAAAQSLAPTRGTYTAVHVQRADGHEDVRDILDIDEKTSFVGIFQLNAVDRGSPNQRWTGTPGPAWTPGEPNSIGDKWMRFQLADGYEVRRLPGDMAFGQIDSEFVNDDGTYKAIDSDEKLADFTSFSVVFDSSGVLMTTVDAGRNAQFDAGDEMFDTSGNGNLWSIATTDNQGHYNSTGDSDLPGEPGVRAFTTFRHPDLPASNRADWLNNNTQILPITSYTGEVFLRE